MRKLYGLLMLATLAGCQQRETITPAQPQDIGNELALAKEAAQKPPVIVVLGSSTAEGAGASTPKKSWVNLLGSKLGTAKVINLAKGGYTTYHMLPTNTATPIGRFEEDTLRNVTAALKYKPTMLILAMTTNDVYFGYSVDEVMTNLAQVRKAALAAGVKRVLISTSMPRRQSTAATQAWVQQRNRTIATYPTDAINFFDCLATAENEIRPDITVDHVHPNDAGHQLLMNEVWQIYNGVRKSALPR